MQAILFFRLSIIRAHLIGINEPNFFMKLSLLVSLTAGGIVLSSCQTMQSYKKLPMQVTDRDLPAFKLHQKSINRSSSVSLSGLASRVRRNNPHLRAAQLRIAEARGKLSQAGRRANPTLGLGLGKSIPGSEGGMEVSFSQRFPVTNRLSLEKRVSKDALLMAQEEVHIGERELITGAQDIAVQVLSLRQQMRQLDAQVASLSKVSAFINEAAARGELSVLDAAQTKMEVQTLNVQKGQYLSEINLLMVQLKSYLGLSPQSALSLSGSLPPVSIPQRSVVLTNRSEYRLKSLQIKHAKSGVLLEKSKRYDDVEASISGGVSREEDAPDGLETEGVVGFGLSIPLPWHNKNEGSIAAAIARAKRLLLEKNAVASDIRQQVARHRAEMQLYRGQSTAIKTKLLPRAKKNTQQLEQAYLNGQGDFTSFLKSKNRQLELQSQLLKINQSFQQARVLYFAALGQENSAF